MATACPGILPNQRRPRYWAEVPVLPRRIELECARFRLFRTNGLQRVATERLLRRRRDPGRPEPVHFPQRAGKPGLQFRLGPASASTAAAAAAAAAASAGN